MAHPVAFDDRCMTGNLHTRRARAGAPTPPLVSVQHRGGRWEVSLPDSRTIACDAFDDALRMARAAAAGRGMCELLVHDAYHRVIHHEVPRPRAQSARRRGTLATATDELTNTLHQALNHEHEAVDQQPATKQ
jgi:hypothetical protein